MIITSFRPVQKERKVITRVICSVQFCNSREPMQKGKEGGDTLGASFREVPQFYQTPVCVVLMYFDVLEIRILGNLGYLFN